MRPSVPPTLLASPNMLRRASNQTRGGYMTSSGRVPSQARWNPLNSNAPRSILRRKRVGETLICVRRAKSFASMDF